MSARGRAEAIRGGEVRAAARLIRDIDDDRPEAIEVLRRLHPHTGRAWRVGITGNPGAGKSTLVDGLVGHLRAAGATVAVIAVDPSSPFSGGAILGDRIRMQRHAADPGVFIRSQASRGAHGGLARGTRAAACVFDAMGFEVILVETVGVGQGEVDVVRAAHTCVVTAVPGLGDGVQAIKAGLLEIADLFVVNKADRPGADRVVRDLEGMLELTGRPEGGWVIPVLETVASTGVGVATLLDRMRAHRAHLQSGGGWRARERRRLRAEVIDGVRAALARRTERLIQGWGGLSALLDEIEAGGATPYDVVDRMIAALGTP